MEEKAEVASMVRGSRASRQWLLWKLRVAGVRAVLAKNGCACCAGAHGFARKALLRPPPSAGVVASAPPLFLMASAATSRVSPACVNSTVRARRAKMESILLALVVLTCAACASPASNTGSQFSVSKPATSTAIEPDAGAPARRWPRTLEIKLTIASAADLRVQPGQHVNAGDVLSDRRIERAPLEAMRQQTQIALNLLIHPKRQPKPQLAPDFTATEQAAIVRAERAEEEARRKVVMTDARIKALNQLASLPPAMRNTVEQHERASRELLERERAAAENELQFARAQAINARKVRATAEYMNAREVSTQTIAEDERIQTATKDEATLRAQLASVDYQIRLLGVVRAPFAGTIKRISWEGQLDHDLTAIVSLAVDDPDATRERAK